MRSFSFCVKINLELGEYAEDQGFLLPNQVSYNPDYFRPRFKIERYMRTFKMKILGTKRWRIFRCQIKYSPENFQWAVLQMAFCAIPQLRWQPQRPLSQLEWQSVELELQLARQRFQRQRSGCGFRKYLSPLDKIKTTPHNYSLSVDEDNARRFLFCLF